MQSGLVFALVCALLAIVYGLWQITRILRLPDGNPRMREIAAAVREGAIAYLWRQYKTIAIVGVVLFLVIGLVPGLGWPTAFGFLIGALRKPKAVGQPRPGTRPMTRNRTTPTMAMVLYWRQR